jgi:hypothetical protein
MSDGADSVIQVTLGELHELEGRILERIDEWAARNEQDHEVLRSHLVALDTTLHGNGLLFGLVMASAGSSCVSFVRRNWRYLGALIVALLAALGLAPNIRWPF